MKKIIFGFLILLIGSTTFALDTKDYITAAYSYGLFTERANNMETQIASNGFDFSAATYFNENWGMYSNLSLFFGSKATISSGGYSLTIPNENWASVFFSGIIGATYNYVINEQFELFGGFGIHFAYHVFAVQTGENIFSMQYGLGGDIGIRYLINKTFYLTGGSLLSHVFFAHVEKEDSYGNTTTENGFYNFGSIRLYIGIGITY